MFLRKLIEIICSEVKDHEAKTFEKNCQNLDENKLGDCKSQGFIILVRGGIPKFIDLLY